MTSARIKGHGIAGGLFVLLFLALLAVRLDVFPGALLPGSGPAASSAGPSRADEDRWMAVYQDGRKIGYSHRRMQRVPRGYRFEESGLLRINTMGVVQDIRMKTTGDLNPDGTLSAFRFDLQSSLFSFVVRGEVRGRDAIVYQGPPSAEKQIRIALREPPHLSNSLYEALRGKALATGQEMTLNVFDPALMAERPVRITVLERETIQIMGRPHAARKVEVDFMGARQAAWLGEDGGVLREQGLLGMTVEQVTKDRALDGLTLAASADLTDAASIPSRVRLDAPETLAHMTVRLANVRPESLLLDGGRQRYEQGRLTVVREAMPAARTTRDALPAEMRPFLQATPFIQSDHPEIRARAARIVSPGDGDAVKARKLVNWVYRNVEKRPVLSVPNALETLTHRVGDCNEHAVLLAALARAAGIPAQIEAGLVYLRGRFYYHAWNVLYVDGWVTADATMGQMPADVTHIRLVRGEADRQIDLAGIIGDIRLEIVDTGK
ncbi:MAG: transglutaminase-like domain-containing protein [Syntrophales bacterium]|nr:transglutaminase-like domain-containing protein [Syntrophales bacterium]